jgi:multiple sugar transport system ATP-binding protein
VAGVTLIEVGKVYADGTRAVENLSLDIADGEFLVLVGPSGCGKTTALRMVAGLEDISEGQVRIGDRVVNRVPSRDRDVAMVFQSYALYPHLSVADNIGFGLQLRKLPKAEIATRVRDAARVLGLEDHLDRKPRNLSGGQRQRVAMGRAIVREPQAFLMDEPLSNLDAKLRVQMRAEIARIQRRLGVTTIYVTHDQVEAMTLGDRVAVMRKGVLQQVDTPQVLYDHPVNLFVAGFIGSPAMNLLEGAVEEDGGTLSFTLGRQRLTVPAGLLAQRPALRSYVGRRVIVGIRPEDIEDAALARRDDPGARLTSTVDLVESMGSEVLVHFTLDAPMAVTEHTRELAEDVGEDPAVLERPGETVVVARFGPRTRAAVDQPIEAVVDTEHMHVFDPETGLSVFGDPADGSAPAVRSTAGTAAAATVTEKGN